MNHTQTLTLTDFLLARLAEDEVIAQVLLARAVGNRRGIETGMDAFECREQGWHVGMSPARVLADVEAKRRIVEIHRQVPIPTICAEHHPPNPAFTHCEYCGSDCHLEHYLGRLLAQPYADHPDFREEWRSAVNWRIT